MRHVAGLGAKTFGLGLCSVRRAGAPASKGRSERCGLDRSSLQNRGDGHLSTAKLGTMIHLVERERRPLNPGQVVRAVA